MNLFRALTFISTIVLLLAINSISVRSEEEAEEPEPNVNWYELKEMRIEYAEWFHDHTDGKNIRRKLDWHGETRVYYIHLPPDYNKKVDNPLVINLHGGGSFAKEAEWISGMIEKSNEEGFIAVHPEATGAVFQRWNGGRHADRARVDDVGFIGAMLDAIEEDFAIDTRRIYATGISSGGFMAYRLASEMSDRIAAIGPVAAVRDFNREPDRPVPIIHFHGTKDAYVRFTGGTSTVLNYEFESVEDTINFWLIQNKCDPDPEIIFQQDEVTSYEYSSSVGADIVLCIIRDGGHVWPGGANNPGGNTFFGYNTDTINATDAIWDFFVKHPMPITVPG